MNKRNDKKLEATALAALLALSALTLFGAPAMTPPDEVLLTGWLHVDDRTVNDLVLVVELDGDRCLFAEVHASGRFEVLVPVGCKALLSFIKPGHLTKEVVVDTRNAMNTTKAQQTNRKVKFDVVLEPIEKRLGRKYQGPVGSLIFVNGTGTMKVKHDLRVVAK